MSSSAKKIKSISLDFGKTEGYRNTILMLVTQENYVQAIEELRNYLSCHVEFPEFKNRAERYILYAIDLVNGIKAKKSFHGIHQLATAKQQELHERAFSHLEDLVLTLKKIERIEREVRLEDVRSTIWVVKAVVHCTLAILFIAFILEMSRGILSAASVLIDHSINGWINWIFDHLGF
jgi:hypothetical protein